MKYIKTITVDISKKIYETIETKNKDTARYLLFKLLDNGVPLDLTSKTVRAYSSADKFNDLVIVDAKSGLCELKLTTEFLGAPGLTHVELTIYEGLETLSSMVFCINNMACLRNDAAIEATNEFSALTVALNKVEVLDKNLNMASTDLEKKYTTRLTNLESQLEDNALTNLETDASLTKLNSVLDGNLVVDRVQGRTLVNLVTTDTSNDTIIDKTISPSKWFIPYSIAHTIDISKYTIIFNIKQINASSGLNITLYFEDNTKAYIPIGNKLGINKYIYKSASKIITSIGIYMESSEFDKGGTCTFNNVMILEGDWTTKEIPSYFTGMKSVAEDNQNKVEISSLNVDKTITDKSEILLTKPLAEYDYIDKDGVHRNNTTEIIDENDTTINIQSTNAYNIINFYHIAKNTVSKMICNLYKVQTTGVSTTTDEGYSFSGSNIYFRVKCSTINCQTSDSNATKIQKFKTWLQTQKTGGNPLTVMYPNTIETIEPLNSSLILSAFKDGYFSMSAGAINPVVDLRFPTNIGERVTAVEDTTIYLRNRYYESLKVQLQLLAKNIELETNKQDKTDSTLTTISKEIAGAINENKAAMDNIKTTRDKEPTINNFTFSSNAENRLPDEDMSVYYKKNGVVRLHINARKDSSSTPFTEGWIVLGTLPIGYRPVKSKFAEGCINTYNSCTSQPFRVTNTGEVSLHLNNSTDTYLIGDIEFYAGGGTI